MELVSQHIEKNREVDIGWSFLKYFINYNL